MVVRLQSIGIRQITGARLDDRLFDYVHFRHGYSKTARCMLVEHLGMEVSDRYEIKLGKIVEKENI